MSKQVSYGVQGARMGANAGAKVAKAEGAVKNITGMFKKKEPQTAISKAKTSAASAVNTAKRVAQGAKMGAKAGRATGKAMAAIDNRPEKKAADMTARAIGRTKQYLRKK